MLSCENAVRNNEQASVKHVKPVESEENKASCKSYALDRRDYTYGAGVENQGRYFIFPADVLRYSRRKCAVECEHFFVPFRVPNAGSRVLFRDSCYVR